MLTVVFLSRILLAAVFLWSGLKKAGASEMLAITIAQLSILPPNVITMTARALPWLEALAGILLLIPATDRAGAGIVSILLCTFMAAIVWALSQGLVVDCGCFGAEGAPSRGKMLLVLARDAAFLAAALLVLMHPGR